MTASRTAALGGSVVAGTGRPLTLIGGPCVIESEALVMEVAERLVDITSRLKPYITATGIEIPNAIVPPGTYALQVTVSDAGGRQSVANVEIEAR